MERKLPLRMCCVCRSMKLKGELYKVVKNKNGEFSIDETGKLPGRGAYVCKAGSCLEKAEKSRCFERAFKCAFPLEFYEILRQKQANEDNL